MSMASSVYIETSIVSYLTSRPSQDPIIYGRQAITKLWWQEPRQDATRFISVLVIEEAQKGDPDAAASRLDIVASLPVLSLPEDAITVADALVENGAIPDAYKDDALHVAIAAVHNMDFLLTWNCKHLANAFLRRKTMHVVERLGYTCPVICTPEELMEA